MNIQQQLYEFLAGPLLFITLPLCIVGLVRKASIIMSGRSRGLLFPAASVFRGQFSMVEPDGSFHLPFSQRNSLFVFFSILFHFAIIAAPVTARGHGILFDLSWGILPPRVSPAVTSSLTGIVMVTGIFFLCRRLFARHVRSISSWRDYAAMACVLLPYVTGMMARGMIGNYEIVMLLHCMGAHVLLVAIGWTRLGHMVFFIAGLLPYTGNAEDLTA